MDDSGESRAAMKKRHKAEVKAAAKRIKKDKGVEKEIRARHRDEMKPCQARWDAEAAVTKAAEAAEAASLVDGMEGASLGDGDGDGDGDGGGGDKANAEEKAFDITKTKAYRRRAKKEQDEKDRVARVAAEREAAGPSARDVESKRIAARVTPLGMRVEEVHADGHCLFRAVAEQVSRLRPFGGVDGSGDAAAAAPDTMQMRAVATAHMRKHGDRYAAFVADECGGDFAAYCDSMVATEPVRWGGQLELVALADALNVDIHVHSAADDEPLVLSPVDGDANTTTDGGGDERVKVHVSFHKHYWTLGEHYNSVVPL
jgi:OTU domain-containing protein 6